ncbi:CLC5A protein, partial [Podargus strigoides]|nr:CLC5A protein [Podargus strigoides]
MSENLIYADLNLTESIGPRLQKVTDVQDSTYAEVKVQSLDTNAAAASGKICCSRTCVTVSVAVVILVLVLVVCLILMYHPTASSPPNSKTFSTTYEAAPAGCPQGWEKNGGKCYFFSQDSEIKDFNASRKECTDMKSDLVIIDNKEELDYLRSQSRGHYYLLGLTYSKSEKKWKWINSVEYNRDMFNITGHSTNYFCTVISASDNIETAPCTGCSTTKNMCEKDANISERQEEN